ncbi:MAG: hypothetical protein LBS35_08355 [Synergistaceae bacterium]|nr:hypothetical protein [Synergistaceae bacterium]
MRGLLILSIIIAIVIFLMPFILGAVIFFIAAIALLTLLANFGLLPGVMTRRHRWIKNGTPRADRRTRAHSDQAGRVSEENTGERGFHDDNEVINLPETALRKDEHAEK